VSRSERGAITPYMMIFISILMLFVGLAWDGGAKLRAGWEAVGVAEEAARAGAGQIDRATAYQHGRFVVDRGAAVRAARSYLRSSGHRGAVTIAGPQSISVTVTVTNPTWILSVVGLSSVTATATATASLIPGIEGPER
jgi:nitrous oxidase accessory protein NosD